jgi:hypothetical protein
MISPLRPTPGTDLTTKALHRPSVWLFSLPQKIEDATERFVSNRAKPQGLFQRAVMSLSKFGRTLADWDFREFSQAGKLKVTSAPIGAACFLFFAVMMGARLHAALKRGKENHNDFREVKDILVRDSISISLFVFGLKALTTLFNKFYQKLPGTGGLQLIDPHSGEVLSYSRFANYRLDSEHALVSLIREGGGEGLKKALQKLYSGGLFEVGGEAAKKHLDTALEDLPELIRQVTTTSPIDAKGQKEIMALARGIYKHLEAGDDVLKEWLASSQKTGIKQAVRMAENAQGAFRDSVIRFAQNRRLPADILGFILIVCMLGWFPGWFNAMRNRREFQREQAKARETALGNYDARLTWQGLQQTSRLGQQRAVRLAQPKASQPPYNPWRPQEAGVQNFRG